MLALLAVGLQLIMPGAMVAATAGGGDLSRYFCAPAGSVADASALAAARQIAALLGEDLPDEAPGHGDCPFCTLAHAFALPATDMLAAPVRYERCAIFIAYTPGHIHTPRGPPTGSRAPPAHA